MKRIETLDTKYIILEEGTLDDALTMIVADYRQRVFRSFMNEDKLSNYLRKKFMTEVETHTLHELIGDFKESLEKPIDLDFYRPILDRIKESDNVLLVPEGLLFYKEVEDIIMLKLYTLYG
jgi:hypothetical protein